MDALVLPLAELDRSAISVAGGKAANLGELLRAGFPVPDGVCLTTEAYRRFVAATGIAPRLRELLATLDPENPASLTRVAASIRELFDQATMPEDLAVAVRSAARSVTELPPYPAGETAEARGVALAVRSSATAEDLPEASFAGQQETYLNVRGEEALRTAVQRCWGSLWTDRAIAYRERNGIAHQDVSLAVVIQPLVPADVSGVLFTANPVSGKRTEVDIEASFGLGEAVVSGLTAPDKYVVDKAHLQILRKERGAKTVQTIAAPGSGTATIAVEERARQSQALPDEAILELAALAMRIEEHFGSPQDIEWAWARGRLHILQTRAITGLYPVPASSPEGGLRVYLSMNAAQGIPEPFTPLGASLLQTVVSRMWSKGPDGYAAIELGGRLYLDITRILKNEQGERWVNSAVPLAEPVAAGILQQLIHDPRLQPKEKKGKWAMARLLFGRGAPVFPLVARTVYFILSPAAARREVDQVAVPKLAALREEVARSAAPGLEGQVISRALHEGFLESFLPHLLPQVFAGLLPYELAKALVRRGGLDENLLAKARQGLPYNQTTIMDLDLWALAERVRADAASATVLTETGATEMTALYRRGLLPPPIQRGMESFLDRYGHRAIREIDLGVPRWREDPTYLFEMLKNYATVEPEAAPDKHFARQAAAGEEAVATLVSQVKNQRGGWWKGRLLDFLLRRYRQLGGLRETPKFYLMWTLEGIRKVLLDSGRRLASEGWIDQPEDVFFLRLEELDEPDPLKAEWRPLIRERRQAYARELRRPRSPRVVTSDGEAFYGETLATGATELSGIGVSPGVARGKARVLRDPQGARLEPGEILVARATDPAWTPLFLTAGGLVMEIGGMLSHGSTVAREYGIPAVVGVVEATTRIAQGQQIEVDGNKGLVTLLDSTTASDFPATKAA